MDKINLFNAVTMFLHRYFVRKPNIIHTNLPDTNIDPLSFFAKYVKNVNKFIMNTVNMSYVR